MFTQSSGEVGLDELHMLLVQHIKPPQTTKSCFIGSPAVSMENEVCVREHPPSSPFWTHREGSWQLYQGCETENTTDKLFGA